MIVGKSVDMDSTTCVIGSPTSHISVATITSQSTYFVHDKNKGVLIIDC